MEAATLMEASSFINVEDLSSRIREVEETATRIEREHSVIDITSSTVLNECADELENNVMRIIEELSNVASLGNAELDAYLCQLKEELSRNEAESAKISEEIEILDRKNNEDFIQFESNLQRIKCSLEYIQLQAAEGKFEKQPYLTVLPNNDNELEVRKINQKVEQFEESLRIFEEYDNLFQRLEAVKNVEDLFSSIEVANFDGSNIVLQLRSRVYDTEIQHEMVIEIDSRSMHLINAKIFPNDVCIDELVATSKSFGNPLERLVGNVQRRIIECYTRQSIANNINKNPRSSCKYVDKEESFVIQLPGEVNACVKVAKGWPFFSSPLHLISLKGKTGKVSPVLHKVNESLLHLKDQCDLSDFIEAIDDAVCMHM